MIQFICPACGDVAEFGYRAAGTRVRCPHCHSHAIVPIDAPLVKDAAPAQAFEPAEPVVIPAALDDDFCLNCGRELANIVPCEKCGRALCSERCLREHMDFAHQTAPARTRSTAHGTREIICPNANCGYRGPPRFVARGSLGVGILLLVLVFPVGLLYFILRSGHRKLCPKCGVQLGSDA